MQVLTKTELRQFTGDLVRYRHSINRNVIYTPGVKHVAEAGNAYWLIDAIASHIGSPAFKKAAERDYRIGSLHFWTLDRDSRFCGVLAARADGPETPFIAQRLEFTDFPLDVIHIWAAYDGEHWTLYLPSEH